MNLSGVAWRGPQSPLAEPHWQEIIQGWREALARCGRRPGRKRVHAMRVATVRLQSPVEVWLSKRVGDDAAGRTARRWMKQAEKLRKTLSPVRDLDVLLEILRGMRSPQAGDVGQVSRAGRACLLEMDKLERRLERKRRSAEQKFSKSIAKKQTAFDEAGEALQQAFGDSNVRTVIDVAAALRGMSAEMAAEAAFLTAETLHDFRKRAKTARYVAEVAQKGDETAKAQAALFKRIQSAVGEWHDWLTLAESAELVLGAGRGDGLVPLLKSLAERSLDKALSESRRLTGELVKLSAGEGRAKRSFSQKKTVQSAGRATAETQRFA